MNTRVDAIVLTTAIVLLASSAAGADRPHASSPLESKVSVVEVGTLYLSSQLFQMAYSEYDALKSRQQDSRFIPQQISSYYIPEPSGKNIHIVARFRSADRSLSKRDAEEICESMIRWVRFHLAIADNGSPLGFTKYGSSTLYQFITPSDVDLDAYERDWALALDKQAIVVGDVGAAGQTNGATAVCQRPLTEPKR